MTGKQYIACDLGAESGRVILGSLSDKGTFTLEEVHRFTNGAANVDGTLRWEGQRIFEELKRGLREVAARGVPVASLSVDSWGVDYVLFNEREPMLSPPYHYRDSRTDRTFSAVLEKAGKERIFAETGIQFMSINTLYQLIAELEDNPESVEAADSFLNIADYFNYRFSGVARAEASLASTTQIYNPKTRDWSAALIRKFGFPKKVFPPIVDSGTRLGPLTPELREETNLPGVEVIATCSHDTGAAVAAVPAADGEDWAYLSSGTWSLIGVELPEPLINEGALEHGFTNEAGFGGTTRFLKNIVGLWILQESRRDWAERGQELDYAEINRLAEDAEPFRSLIDPNAGPFLKPDDMPAKIAAFCRDTGQPEPETPGQFGRCILESLALLYKQSLEAVEELTGRKISTLHIVGGGCQSALLNQFAASATGREVLAGPVEATAVGNLLIQAIALGDLNALADLRRVVRDSFPIQSFAPQKPAEWAEAFERFSNLNFTKTK